MNPQPDRPAPSDLPHARYEYRKDPIVDRWVIIAPDRAARPNEFEPPPPARSSKECPFCEGNEFLTPHEIAAYRTSGSHAEEPGWRVRVIPNKYPAIDVHEVIIESPRHLVSTTELSEAELVEVLSIYRDRLQAVQKQPDVRFAMVFKNVGPAAGASIEHAHSQLVGLPMVPSLVAAELDAAAVYFQQKKQCIYCDLLERELTERERLVLDSPGFAAFCPYAARFPFETWLLPRQHSGRFDQIPEGQLPELAFALRSCIEKIERISGRSQYNYLIHSAPFDTAPQSHYHWHIEIFPRTTTIAGFEWGTGQFINPVAPEEAARLLCQQ